MWTNPQFYADSLIVAKKILNRKLHFLRAVWMIHFHTTLRIHTMLPKGLIICIKLCKKWSFPLRTFFSKCDQFHSFLYFQFPLRMEVFSSDTGISLRILQNFRKQRFCGTCTNNCLWRNSYSDLQRHEIRSSISVNFLV